MAYRMTPKRKAALRKAQLASARKRKGKKKKFISSKRKKTLKKVGKTVAKGAIGGAMVLGGLNASVSLAAQRGIRYSAQSGAAGLKTGAKIGAGVAAVAYGIGAIRRRRKRR